MLEMDHEAVSKSMQTLKIRIAIFSFTRSLLTEGGDRRYEVGCFGKQLLHGAVITTGGTLGVAVGEGLAEVMGDRIGRATDHVGDGMTMVQNIRVLRDGGFQDL